MTFTARKNVYVHCLFLQQKHLAILYNDTYKTSLSLVRLYGLHSKQIGIYFYIFYVNGKYVQPILLRLVSKYYERYVMLHASLSEMT